MKQKSSYFNSFDIVNFSIKTNRLLNKRVHSFQYKLKGISALTHTDSVAEYCAPV